MISNLYIHQNVADMQIIHYDDNLLFVSQLVSVDLLLLLLLLLRMNAIATL